MRTYSISRFDWLHGLWLLLALLVAAPLAAAPTLQLGPDQQVLQGDLVSFHAEYQGATAPVTLRWDFGDGYPISGSNATPGHVYSEAGAYRVTLTLTDAQGQEATAALWVTVARSDQPLVVEVATGWGHSLALYEDGRVVAWGRNTQGQLGDGSEEDRAAPVAVVDGDGVPLQGIVAIAAGYEHALALHSDGQLYAWGEGASGQLGDGTVTARNQAALVRLASGSPLEGIVAIAAGWDHNLALAEDGTLYAWGLNGSGQVGDGSTMQRNAPVVVGGLSAVAAIAAGGDHSLALAGGTLYSWGSNQYGQLGEGSGSEQTTPVAVALSHVTALAAGAYHTLALDQAGAVWAWGRNQQGQLGDGTTQERALPVAVKWESGAPVSGVAGISAGDYHNVVRLDDGSLWSWGANGSGQLGSGDKAGRGHPVAVIGADGGPLEVVQAAAGGNHSLALDAQRRVLAWGNNEYGQLGNGMNDVRPGRDTAVVVRERMGQPFVADQIAAGGYHSVALHGGAVSAWGYNGQGQLGDGATGSRSFPLPVVDAQSQPLQGFVAVASGDGHGVALHESGLLYAWGDNRYGQLGDGTTTGRRYAALVMENDSTALGNLIALAAGLDFTLALRNDGTLFAWGDNRSGQLGDGSTEMRTTPVAVQSGVEWIAAGAFHAFARTTDGRLWGWGGNGFGQLGDGSSEQRLVAVEIASGCGNGATAALAAGDGHSLARCSGGELFAWGANGEGQLGDGTTRNRSVAAAVAGEDGVGLLTNGSALGAGSLHSQAVTHDGSVLLWGSAWDSGVALRSSRQPVLHPRESGEPLVVAEWSPPPRVAPSAGSGERSTRAGSGAAYPEALEQRAGGRLRGIVEVAAGDYHGLGRQSDGTLFAWGDNQAGQLGDGTNSLLPGPVVNGAGEVISRLDPAPQVAAGASQQVVQGDWVSFRGNVQGAEGGELLWLFGDGQTASGSLTPSHRYLQPGRYPVRLVVRSAEGVVVSDHLEVVVADLGCRSEPVVLRSDDYASVRSTRSIESQQGASVVLSGGPHEYRAPVIRFHPGFRVPAGSTLRARAMAVSCP